MDNEQILDVINAHFNILEAYGSADTEDIIVILYLMFIYEYYNVYRDITLQNIGNDEVGLTDCMVRKLNAKIECLKMTSDLLQCVDLYYLPTKNHWIMPDCEPDEPDEPDTPDEPDIPDIPTDEDCISNNTLYTIGTIEDNTLYTYGIINNHILQL